MTCDKPNWEWGVDSDGTFPSKIPVPMYYGEWGNTTINGTTYITVDGIPRYTYDKTGDLVPATPEDRTDPEWNPFAKTGNGLFQGSMDERPIASNSIIQYALHPEPMTIIDGIPGPQGPPGVEPEQLQGVDKAIGDHEWRVYQLEGEIDSLNAKVERLERQVKDKLDKPSVAPELVNAEAYIDDYLQASRKMKRGRHARKQRIQGKLARISRIKKESKMESKKVSKNIVLLGAIFTVISAAAVVVSFGLFGPLGQ